MERKKKLSIVFQRTLTREKVVGVRKDIGWKLMSETDVMSLSDVIYRYVSKILTQLTKSLVTKILSIN